MLWSKLKCFIVLLTCLQIPPYLLSSIKLLAKDAEDCHHCPTYFWSNEQKNYCVPMATEYLAISEPLALAILATNIFGILFSVAIMLFLYLHQKVIEKRKWNTAVKVILLVSLVGCFSGYKSRAQSVLHRGFVFFLLQEFKERVYLLSTCAAPN